MPIHRRLKLDTAHNSRSGDYSLMVGDVINAHPQGIANKSAGETLKKLLPRLAKRYAFKDYTHLLIPAIVYCANKRSNAPPLWMLVPGPSSLGKTTAINFILGLDHVHELGNITAAGFLSGAKKDSEQATGGILAQSMAEGGWSIFTFKDMTSILSGDSKDIEKTLSALREIYDGNWSRHLGTEGGRKFEYTGKCGIVGGLTLQAAEKMHHRGAEMGERCLHCYIPPVTNTRMSKTIGKQAIMNIFAKDLGRDIPDDEELKDLYVTWMGQFDQDAATLDIDEIDSLAEYAEVIASCRVHIPKDRNHKLTGIPHAEATARAAGELALMFAAARGLGIATPQIWQMVRNVTSSTMPVKRINLTRGLTSLLSEKSEVTLKEIAEHSYRNPDSGLFAWPIADGGQMLAQQIEDLMMIGIVKQVKKGGTGIAAKYTWDDGTIAGQYFKKLM